MAVVLLTVGLAGLLLVSSQGFAFILGPTQREFVSIPEPASYLSPLYLMLLLVPPIPLALVGAVLVTISPLYRPVDRVAAWLVLPWCFLSYALSSVVLHAADPCAWSGSTCTGISPAIARATLLAATTVTVVGVVLVLVRIARARTMRPAAAASWWPATAVTLGLLVSSLPVVALPLTYREGTYASFSVDGLVPYPGTLGAVLGPVLMTAPLWVAVVITLVRSSLWGRRATVVGVALVPLLLLAAILVTALPGVLTPSVLTASNAIAGAGGVLALGVAGWLFAQARRRT